MGFLLNAWYMIGWAKELDAGFVHRRIADQPILVYRLPSGVPAAIQDRCPHRFVPLHLGKQVGDTIECGYHGLCFGPDGRCVKNPVDGAPIPKAAQVRSYPVVARYGVLWVWPGDREAADPATIPDYSFLVDPKRATVQGYMLTKANYELAIDNLSDLTHVQYVHGEYQASEAFPNLKSEVLQDGTRITTRLTLPGGKVPFFFANAVPRPDMAVDLVYEVEWNAPSNATLRARGYVPGDRTTPRFDIRSAHIVSAETQGTCHYFFGNSRDYALDDPEADEKVRAWQRIGFVEQDKPMLEAQQASVGDRDLLEMNPVLLHTDAGSVRIRRTLRKLIQNEQRPTHA
ncbi:MAG TPA: aromatic ring-hydroxylating dioxygenase subunit alpha [Ramlibacter sp.]|nr:aromatic ring-hydroxylating dioxygenase subunit alpha [Ramlibacter sp.]